MRSPLVAAFPLVLLLSTPAALAPAAARAQSSGPLTTTFISKVSSTDAFERDAGRLAQQRSQNPQVKAFAAKMVAEHARTAEALRQALEKNSLPMPGENRTADPTQSKLLTDMQFAPQEKFDQAYVHGQVVAHQTALALMQEYAARGDNPDLKKLAADTEGVVRMHLDMAMKLEAELGGPPKAVGRKIDG